MIADLWERIEPKIDKAGAERKHLLWSLVFLNIYGSSEEVYYAIVGWPYKQTFREWLWYFDENNYGFQDDVIVFRNWFDGQPDLNDIEFNYITFIDGIDCPCSEPYPFLSTDISSIKFNSVSSMKLVSVSRLASLYGSAVMPSW